MPISIPATARPARAGSQGFTLLEMLVALAIFSLAALALVRLQAVTVRTAADLTDRTIAQIVARNLAFERLTDVEAPTAGTSSGLSRNAGRDWRWTQTVAPADEGRLVAITVRVESVAGASPAVLTVTRLVP
jgi:general secretion pathway protein I